MKNFFNKIWAWLKETTQKLITLIKAKKLISCIVGGVLVVAIACAIILPIALNGDKEKKPSNENNASYAYRIVVDVNGYGLRSVKVDLYDGETLVASEATNSNGYANFYDIEQKDYVVKVTAPNGYALQEDKTYKTGDLGTQLYIGLTPTGVISETAPNGTTYSLGDVVYDFSIQTSDNSTFTLSEVLEQKEMVMINFWATWCGPCQSEFPAMNNAYAEYQDKVAILAVSTTDDNSAVAGFKDGNGLAFDMAADTIGLQNKFNVGPIPHTVFIDRDGVVSFVHVGSMTSKTDFTSRFDLFCGLDYQTTIIAGDGSSAVDPDIEEENRVLPNVDAPAPSAIKKALNASDDFSYSWNDNDEYSWPWLASDEGYMYTPTTGLASSYAELYINFEITTANTALFFDYFVSSEPNYDVLYVLLDGLPVTDFSGANQRDWATCTAYVFNENELGKHTLQLIFLKDGETSVGEDIVKIKNLHFGTPDEITSNSSYIFRYAATQLNEDANATTQFKNYANVVYNETDGYYHVETVDGPILFAMMMQSTEVAFMPRPLWNQYHLWDLALNQMLVDDEGFSYKDDVEDYAWESNNNMVNPGYTPVTEELKELLDTIAYYVHGVIGEKFAGPYHENEWLEFCAYYQPYGATKQFKDPMGGITYHAAIPVYENVNNPINVPFAINPRGFKYVFVPEKSGVYNIASNTDSYGVDNRPDPECFFSADGGKTLRHYTDVANAKTYVDSSGVTLIDGNFSFYEYLEAGKKYYILCTTFLDSPAQYGLTVKYIGDTYRYLTAAATGPYSFNPDSEGGTNELFIPNAIDFIYADPEKEFVYAETNETAAGDGYYHYKHKDGSLGSIIYLETQNATSFFATDSLQSIVNGAAAYEETKRALYVNGKDYTDDVSKLCFKSLLNTGDLYGKVPVDKAVYDIIYTITTSAKYEGIWNSWLMMCYYYTSLSAPTK